MSEAQTESVEQNGGPADFSAIVDRSRLRSWLSVLMAVHDEGRVDVSVRGFESTIIGPSNVAGVDTTLGVDGFESLDVDSPGTVGVDFKKLDEVLGSMSGSELVELSYGDDSRKLVIKGNTSTYESSTIDIEELSPQTFDIDYDGQKSCSIVLSPGDIKDATDLVSVCDEVVHVGYDDSTGEFLATGSGDTDDVEVSYGDETYKAADYSSPDDQGDGKIDSMFTIDYIEKQLKPTDSSTELAMIVGDTMPMIWRYTLDDFMQVRTLIAPRIPGAT